MLVFSMFTILDCLSAYIQMFFYYCGTIGWLIKIDKQAILAKLAQNYATLSLMMCSKDRYTKVIPINLQKESPFQANR